MAEGADARRVVSASAHGPILGEPKGGAIVHDGKGGGVGGDRRVGGRDHQERYGGVVSVFMDGFDATTEGQRLTSTG